MDFNTWVNASGIVKVLRDRHKRYFADYGGKEIDEFITGCCKRNDLITTPPNHLKPSGVNFYVNDLKEEVFFYADERRTNIFDYLTNPEFYKKTCVMHPFMRHFDANGDEDNGLYAKEVMSTISYSYENPIFKESHHASNRLKQALSTIGRHFANTSYMDALTDWFCDTFMSISRYNNSDEIEFKGYLSLVHASGVRFDIEAIKRLIEQLPIFTREGAPPNLASAKQYLKKTLVFKKLSSTNKYLAFSCLLQEFWNKSELSKVDYYVKPNSKFIKTLKIIDEYAFPPEEDERFLNTVTKYYVKLISESLPYNYVTNSDEQKLLQLCKEHCKTIGIEL